MAEKNETGKQGEAVAKKYLEESGYQILDTNWRFRRYEIDIVAQTEEELIFVEVKTRSDNYLVAPEEAVDKRKIRRIVVAADAYARKYNIGLPIRFDIVCLIKKGLSYHIENHIEDAFYAPIR